MSLERLNEQIQGLGPRHTKHSEKVYVPVHLCCKSHYYYTDFFRFLFLSSYAVAVHKRRLIALLREMQPLGGGSEMEAEV